MGPKKDFGKANVKKALAQSALVAATAFICFLIASYTRNGFLVTSIAASAYIAIVLRKSDAASPRGLMGGYACGIIGGLAGSLVYGIETPGGPGEVQMMISCIVAVFLASLCMLLFRAQHPPAAALAVSVVLDSDPLLASAIALVCIAIIFVLKLAAERLWDKRQARRMEGD